MISFEYRRRSSLPPSSFFIFTSFFLAFISAPRPNLSSRKSLSPPPLPSSRFSTTPFRSLFSFLSILTALNLVVKIAQAQSSDPSSPSPTSSTSPSTTDNNDNSNDNANTNADGNRNDRNNNSDIDPDLMAAAAPPAPLPTSTGGRQPRSPVQSSTTPINVASPTSFTAAPLPTTTTTTVRTFSDHIITVDRPTSTNNGVVSPTPNIPTESPYGWTDDKNTNGGLMLTVSLVVVFVVLAGLILVVFCLCRRRSALARRQMRQLSKGASSSSVLENGHASNGGGKTGATLRDGQNRHSFSGIRSTSGGGSRSSGIFLSSGGAGLTGSTASNGSGNGTPGTGSYYGASEIDITRALQEMSELHQSHRLSKRSSTLSLGHSRMLSPVMSAAAVAGARPASLMGSGYYSGSNSGTPGGHSRANSFVMGGGSSSTGTGGGRDNNSGHLLESSSSSGPSEFTNSQYDEHYGQVSPLPQPHYQHQQQQEFMQEPSPQLLGAGQDDEAADSVQITDRAMSPASSLPPASQVHVRPFPLLNRSTGHLPMHGERPYSMMVAPQSSSTLVIPPSITTRRRSMMNTNSMYVAQADQRPFSFIAQQQQPAYYASSPPPPPQSYQQQQHHSIYPPQPYQFQQYDYVDSPRESSPAVTDSTHHGYEEGTSAAAAADTAIHSMDKLEPKREEDRDDAMGAEGIGAGVGSGSPSSSLLLGTRGRPLTLTSDAEAQPKIATAPPPQTTAVVPLPDTKAPVTARPSASDSEMTHSSIIPSAEQMRV